MNRKYRFGPGAALITLLAVVLAMSALGVLTLLSARGDEVLSERAARVAESVARLDVRAEESLAALDAARLPETDRLFGSLLTLPTEQT